MIRGTTPTFTLRVPDVDLTRVEEVYVTVRQANTAVTKTGNDIQVETIVDANEAVQGSQILCWLTERESLALSEGVDALIQVNWTYLDNAQKKRAATKTKLIEIDKQLLNGAITT